MCKETVKIQKIEMLPAVFTEDFMKLFPEFLGSPVMDVDLGRDSIFYRDELLSKLQVLPRNQLEKVSSRRVHFATYSVLYSKKHNLAVFYTRNGKGGEKRLSNRLSIGIGGHVELGEDFACFKNSLDLPAMFKHANKRELNEEIYFTTTKTQKVDEYLQVSDDHYLLDDTCYDRVLMLHHPVNDVSKVHVGVVFVYDLDKGIKIKHTHQGTEDCKTITIDDLKSGRFIIQTHDESMKLSGNALEKLSKLFEDENTEEWSKVIIDYLLDSIKINFIDSKYADDRLVIEMASKYAKTFGA